jgi:hypothetical protein
MANRVGRIQRGVLRGLVANRARPVSTVALLRWCYPQLRGKFAPKASPGIASRRASVCGSHPKGRLGSPRLGAGVDHGRARA